MNNLVKQMYSMKIYIKYKIYETHVMLGQVHDCVYRNEHKNRTFQFYHRKHFFLLIDYVFFSVFLKIKPAKTLKNIPTAHIQGVKYSSMNCNVLKDSGIGYDVIL
jgi:hypothetical protein